MSIGLNTVEYRYNLPPEKIARFPLALRDQSNLLVYRQGIITDSTFDQLPAYLPTGSLLLMNDSRVIPARLQFVKVTGSTIEIFLLHPQSPHDYSEALKQHGVCVWQCMIGNVKKWKGEVLTRDFQYRGKKETLTAERINRSSNLVRFTFNDSLMFGEVLNELGTIPLPPYLNRAPVNTDKERYQTIYARHSGSVAAPTAGLHFTDEVLKKLMQKNIKTDTVTLHIGAGTFKPVTHADITQHPMHTEFFIINRKILDTLLQYRGNITVTGTTTLRCLESIYWLGVKRLCHDLSSNLYQWEDKVLRQDIPPAEALEALLRWIEKQPCETFTGSTALMIVPGYRFRMVDRLITNFHQPASTLLMLVAAFIGPVWKNIYKHALDGNYRFLSYGDSSLLFKV